ncbi:MAG: zinc-dependent peptidase [Bacteroidota bacterium]
MGYISIGIIALAGFWVYKNIWPKWNEPEEAFPLKWKKILLKKVVFYNSLNEKQQELFDYKVHEFLLNHKVIGVGTDVDITDKLLVAASAVIPIFAFPKWRYKNLQEVLIYPNKFNHQFQTEGQNRNILGMVGTGYMEGKMILAKTALHHGFSIGNDKRNTAIHEFVHLIDKSDGVIDGIPSLLLDRPYVIPWFDLMNKKIEEIYADRSDINPYGGTNKAEFFSVVSEYFFEQPRLLSKKHPELYKLLEDIFDQDLDEKNFHTRKVRIGRNEECLCGSGKKFKHCCLS